MLGTLDWQVPPPYAFGDPLGVVRTAIWGSMPADAGRRAADLFGVVLERPFFSDEEAGHAFCCMLCSRSGHWTGRCRVSS